MSLNNFKSVGVGGYAGYELTDQLLYNIKAFLDWGLLQKGGYNFYLLNQDSFFAENESKLRATTDGRYPQNCIWEGVGEWVWESGVTPINSGEAPFRPSGVYINEIFIPSSSTGPSRHHFDFLNGRVIFEEGQNPDDDIRAEYTSRAVRIRFSDSSEFQNLMLESIEEFLSNTVPSGTTSKDHGAWLPSIYISIDSGTGRGLELGGGQIKTRVVTLHIFCDTAGDRNLLLDLLDYNNRTAFTMFDLNKIPFPINEFGSPVSGATNWVDLMDTYSWKKLRITEGSCKTINSLNTKLFRGQVRWNIEVDLGNI
jgi:hypothetical protein